MTTTLKLTPKQRKFCQEYAGSGNATTAAERAGYSRKTAHSIGAENLRKPVVREYLETLTSKPEESRITTAIERQLWLSRVIAGEIPDFIPSNGTVMERPAKLADRIRACELLARMRGELLDKYQISGKLDRRVTVVERIIVDATHRALTETMSNGEQADCQNGRIN